MTLCVGFGPGHTMNWWAEVRGDVGVCQACCVRGYELVKAMAKPGKRQR